MTHPFIMLPCSVQHQLNHHTFSSSLRPLPDPSHHSVGFWSCQLDPKIEIVMARVRTEHCHISVTPAGTKGISFTSRHSDSRDILESTTLLRLIYLKGLIVNCVLPTVSHRFLHLRQNTFAHVSPLTKSHLLLFH